MRVPTLTGPHWKCLKNVIKLLDDRFKLNLPAQYAVVKGAVMQIYWATFPSGKLWRILLVVDQDLKVSQFCKGSEVVFIQRRRLNGKDTLAQIFYFKRELSQSEQCYSYLSNLIPKVLPVINE